jgi:FtsP/CotA-like multicopper oxidase with cupredoxin domain
VGLTRKLRLINLINLSPPSPACPCYSSYDGPASDGLALNYFRQNIALSFKALRSDRMAISLSNFLLPIALLLSIVRCDTVTYDFDISWVYANPDGIQTRPVIGINGQWPIPTIRVTKGDQVLVNVKNSLGNETTSLHFHGIYQNGTTHMDGPEYVTQCAIQPGKSFTYNFTVSEPPPRRFLC